MICDSGETGPQRGKIKNSSNIIPYLSRVYHSRACPGCIGRVRPEAWRDLGFGHFRAQLLAFSIRPHWHARPRPPHEQNQWEQEQEDDP